MALNKAKEEEALDRAREVGEQWGSPAEIWAELVGTVQDTAIRDFAEISDQWLKFIWCLDQYRIADAPPSGMGDTSKPYDQRIDGIYRGKGNQFSTLLSLLLENRTNERIRSRSRVEGFSQTHQIDLAWPGHPAAPVVCGESKLTGGPAYRGYRGRGAMDDWTNRRKELKFSATDLKLSRRAQTQRIGHWDVWRRSALPKTFLLWGATLSRRDSPDRMVKEVAAIVATYLDGAGIAAWTETNQEDGYELIALPDMPTVETIDVALWRIETEIAEAISKGAPDEEPETASPVDLDQLADESSENGNS
ncbi:MAG TPA: hypothetical protein VFE25_06995 [Opitutaceae bacterium]|jgi:hypothetical protein|nr:hypothetical protein [Opitutaceae bacterium]